MNIHKIMHNFITKLPNSEEILLTPESYINAYLQENMEDLYVTSSNGLAFSHRALDVVEVIYGAYVRDLGTYEAQHKELPVQLRGKEYKKHSQSDFSSVYNYIISELTASLIAFKQTDTPNIIKDQVIEFLGSFKSIRAYEQVIVQYSELFALFKIYNAENKFKTKVTSPDFKDALAKMNIVVRNLYTQPDKSKRSFRVKLNSTPEKIMRLANEYQMDDFDVQKYIN